MTEDKTRLSKLQAEKDYLESFAELSPVGFFRTDAEGQVNYVNTRWCEICGISRDQAFSDGWQDALHPDDRDKVAEAWSSTALKGLPYQLEQRYQRPDGTNVTCYVQAFPERDDQENIIGYVGTVTDVSAHKRQENALRIKEIQLQSLLREAESNNKRLEKQKAVLTRLTAELKRSNSELEKFAYVASHDLQEPLRKVQAFGDRLRSRAGDSLDEDCLGYLDRMQSASKRMQGLILDLLNYSRVATTKNRKESCDLNVIVGDVLTDLEVRIQENSATVAVELLPTIEADPVAMRQLMQNLIGNALKYRRPDVDPEVQVLALEITAEEANYDLDIPAVCITIKDNGIGFEPEQAERIFGIFQRLHGRGQYEGTGIGLAVCTKIVERHHGRLTATGQPNVGATMTLLLPVTQPVEETFDDMEEAAE